MGIKSTQAHTDMMLRTGLIGKINVFHLKHPFPMLNMYCILELMRGITIPQIYMAKRAKKRFGAKILLKTSWNLSEVEYGLDLDRKVKLFVYYNSDEGNINAE